MYGDMNTLRNVNKSHKIDVIKVHVGIETAGLHYFNVLVLLTVLFDSLGISRGVLMGILKYFS